MSAVHQLHSMHLADMTRALRDKALAAGHRVGHADGYRQGHAVAAHELAVAYRKRLAWCIGIAFTFGLIAGSLLTVSAAGWLA